MINSAYWLGMAALPVVLACLCRPSRRLMDALELLLRGRLAVDLERERRLTLIEVLDRLPRSGEVR